MKDILRTRLEFLWAKLAGRDVDIGTLTPDAPTNMVEKLMLETAERIDEVAGDGGGGSSGPFIVNITIDNQSLGHMDKTWREIRDAFVSGKTCLTKFEDDGYCVDRYGLIYSIDHEHNNSYNQYNIYFFRNTGYIEMWSVTDENEYPYYNYD